VSSRLLLSSVQPMFTFDLPMLVLSKQLSHTYN
jgi:hypothetical protein